MSSDGAGRGSENRELMQGIGPLTARMDFHSVAPAVPADIDLEEYLPELAGFDLTEEQARELLGILAWMMGFFVHYGFDGDSCGQILQAILTDANGPKPHDILLDSASEA